MQAEGFIFELAGFNSEVGQRFEGILKAPHIKKGDWIVEYQPHEYRIVRVVNESQFLVDMLQ
jgi:hypothetical protein